MAADRADLRRLLNQAAREDPPSLDLRRKLLASMTINEEELRKSIASDEKKAMKAKEPRLLVCLRRWSPLRRTG
jgi:hypothetical protein